MWWFIHSPLSDPAVLQALQILNSKVLQREHAKAVLAEMYLPIVTLW